MDRERRTKIERERETERDRRRDTDRVRERDRDRWVNFFVVCFTKNIIVSPGMIVFTT